MKINIIIELDDGQKVSENILDFLDFATKEQQKQQLKEQQKQQLKDGIEKIRAFCASLKELGFDHPVFEGLKEEIVEEDKAWKYETAKELYDNITKEYLLSNKNVDNIDDLIERLSEQSCQEIVDITKPVLNPGYRTPARVKKDD